MGVYYVSKENLFVPKKVGEYTDLSFLLPEYVNGFIKDIDKLFLTDSEIELKKIDIIRKSKFPQNPKRSVRFSGKRTKRSVQKRKARNTQKAETKVL